MKDFSNRVGYSISEFIICTFPSEYESWEERMTSVDISYYFWNKLLNKQGIEEFLLLQVGQTVGNKSNFTFRKQDESEDGEGDTLYVKCNFFSFTTSLYDVKNISRDYDINVNYGLECNIYADGERKFIEFIGNLLNNNIGEAILLKDSEYRVLVKRKNYLTVDSHFFDCNEALNLAYIQGTYKNVSLRINGSFITEEIKLECINLIKDYENEYVVRLVEDPDYLAEFSIVFGELQINISNVGTAINLSCRNIFILNDDFVMKKLLCIFKEFITQFSGDYQLLINQGYWEQKGVVLSTRESGKITINNLAEEAKLLHEILYDDK